MKNSPVNALALLRLWNKGTPADEICVMVGITHTRLMQIARIGNFKDWQKLRRPRTNKPVPPPTLKEIRQRAALVRSRWTPEERERRIVGPRRSRVEMRAFALTPDYAFQEYRY